MLAPPASTVKSTEAMGDDSNTSMVESVWEKVGSSVPLECIDTRTKTDDFRGTEPDEE